MTAQAETVTAGFCDSAAGAFLWGGSVRPWHMGQAVYPVLTSRPTVHGPFTASDDAADTTGAFDGGPATAEADTAPRFIYRRTDAMQFGSGMDSGAADGAERRVAGKARP